MAKEYKNNLSMYPAPGMRPSHDRRWVVNLHSMSQTQNAKLEITDDVVNLAKAQAKADGDSDRHLFLRSGTLVYEESDKWKVFDETAKTAGKKIKGVILNPVDLNDAIAGLTFKEAPVAILLSGLIRPAYLPKSADALAASDFDPAHTSLIPVSQ